MGKKDALMGRSLGDRSSSNGPPSHRLALRGAALVALLILGAVLTACGGSAAGGSGSSGGETTSEEAEAGTPVKGGVLTFARSVDADVGLNPINAPSNG